MKTIQLDVIQMVFFKINLCGISKEINAALFTIARAWKQPRCPSADEWIKSCGTYTQWNITQPTKEHI